ncbi:hypothetical protein FIBSPDRAFT_1055307 [Athelia psychrophila]|uniref:Uncharacterized protein n=1 Tax=Athelia psychrophila TaxID=1759441 RepID=A0A167TYL8_9AGAM|nr:hypothetical protein FIBSPDRAFT_1055307 [Fibularhizoctonia sp. CBS 109695]
MSPSTASWPRIQQPIPIEYASQHIRCELIHYQMSTSLAASKLVNYYGFTGIGSPPLGLGEPGDLYVDENPDTMELYARDANFEWRAWSGPHSLHTHPNSEDWCLWASASGFAWFSPKFVRDDGAPSGRGGMDRRAMIAQALTSYKMGVALAGHQAPPDAQSGSMGTKRTAPTDGSDNAERHKRPRQGKQPNATHTIPHVLSGTPNDGPSSQLDEAITCENCSETQKSVADLDDLLKKAMDRAIVAERMAEELTDKRGRSQALHSPSLMAPSVEGQFTALFDTWNKSFFDVMRSVATATAEAHDAAMFAAAEKHAAAQAAILQTAQKDKEAAERAATKKISLLENHAAAQAAISQTAVQKDKEAAEKAATKCISLLRVQMDDAVSKRKRAEGKLAGYLKSIQTLQNEYQ